MSEPRKKLDWTKPLQTKGGLRATKIEAFPSAYYPRKVFFGDGSYYIYTESGCFYFCADGGPDDHDLINVPEPTEQPSIGENVADHGRRLDEFWKRCDKIEERLGAIERRNYVPPLPALPDDESGEPEDCEPVVTREPSVVYRDQPPFHVGQVVECVDVMPGWSLVKVGEKHKIEGVKPIGIKFSHSGYWYNPSCFRALPPTAERESEPTPGMVFMADESRGISTIRAIVECVMMNLHQNNHDFRLRDKLIVAAAPYLEKHEKETAALRAECERLTKELSAPEYQYAGGRIRREAIEYRNNEISDLRQQLTAKDVEIERLKEDNIKTCQLVADMHAAATGKPGDGPRRGVVEDIADLRQQLATANAENKRQRQIINDNFASTAERVAELEQQLATHREAAEAMEAIKSGKVRRVHESDIGMFRAVSCSGADYYADTPTAAILAAKAASERTQQGATP